MNNAVFMRHSKRPRFRTAHFVHLAGAALRTFPDFNGHNFDYNDVTKDSVPFSINNPEHFRTRRFKAARKFAKFYGASTDHEDYYVPAV